MEVTERDALTVAGLRKTFEAENAPVRALRGIDLTVRAGEFVAVMGPSGCGKSTLLNLVAGLDVPDEGTITVAGETVTGRTEDDLARLRRKHMGIVFQFFNLLEGMTVLENVVLPSVIAGRRRKMAETRARDLLDLLGIGDKAAAVPGVLSGGQRQRLAIARALANQPTLLLADEPTGALDSAGGAEIIELLRRLHRQAGDDRSISPASGEGGAALDDLRGARRVERTEQLVGEQQRGLVGERAGDRQPLPLPAGEHAGHRRRPCRRCRAGRAGHGPEFPPSSCAARR